MGYYIDYSSFMEYRPSLVKAVLFDFDGTLTMPGALDFPAFKKSIGCPPDQTVLEFIQSLPDPSEQKTAWKELDEFEMAAAEMAEPNTGAEDLIRYLRAKDLRLGIISRNSRASIERAFKNFGKVSPADFDVILARDDTVNPKPDPEGILQAARSMNIEVDQTIIVGDFIFDIQAGKAAGAVTVFLDNHLDKHKDAANEPVPCDHRIPDLDALKKIVRMALPLPAGKFPNDLLEQFFDRFSFEDPSILIHPGVGEDTAAVDVVKEEVLVLKSDPITFATDAIGQYAVLVNANDIATAGAKPRWLLTTLLFPCESTGAEILQTMQELQDICRKWDITLCGGHTEITDAVTRPVIIGMLTGTVLKKNLVDKRNIKTGDQVLLTKAIAVEGTAIIAREFGGRLKRLGMIETDIETCKQFLSQLSILKEAEIAAKVDGVSAMHDITEGGLATALNEMSVAGRHRIKVDMNRIPIFSQTEKISHLMGIDPMGLIGSGSLLICCRKDDTDRLIKQIQNAGIKVTCIGEVTESGQGIEAERSGKAAPWPCFEVDEITRLFE